MNQDKKSSTNNNILETDSSLKKRRIADTTDVCDSLLSLHKVKGDINLEKSSFVQAATGELKKKKDQLKATFGVHAANIPPDRLPMVMTKMSSLFTESRQTNENILEIINKSFEEMEKLRESFDSQCVNRMNAMKKVIADKMLVFDEFLKVKKEILQYETNIEEIKEEISTAEIKSKKLIDQLNEDLNAKITERDCESQIVGK